MNLNSLTNDARNPVEVPPDEAERMGAFVEDALTEQDAIESRDGLKEVDGALTPIVTDEEMPAFIDKDIPGYKYEPPSHIRTASIRELYGWQPGESLDAAIARTMAQKG